MPENAIADLKAVEPADDARRIKTGPAPVEPEPETIAVPYTYDAFISYSHNARQLAISKAFQQAVQGFAKPFWKRRALHLFRDQTNLSADPDLWGNIEDALEQSRYLILIASPEAASSKWVAKEITWWLEHREADAILIVLVVGSLRWADGRFDEAGTTALPRLLHDAFAAEPLWLDLTGLATDPTAEGWQRDDRFVAAVASVASRLRGIPKDELFGEDLARHQQTRHAIQAVISVITVLLIVTVGAALFANEKRKEALRRADEITAAFIWSRLDFEWTDDPRSQDAVRGLWDLYTAPRSIRDAFLTQIGSDPHQLITLAIAAGSIAHAFGLRPAADDVGKLLGPLLAAIRQGTMPAELQIFAQGVQALRPLLNVEQARSALGPVLESIEHTTDPDQLQALVQAALAIGLETTPEQAPAVLGRIVGVIAGTAKLYPLYRLPALAQAVRTIGPGLTPAQAEAAFASVLKVVQEDATPEDLAALVPMVHTFGRNLTPEQSRGHVDTVLGAVRRTTNPDQLAALAHAMQALGATPEQARTAFGPVLAAVKEASPDAREDAVLTEAIQILGAELGPDQAMAELGSVLDGLQEFIQRDQHQVLVQAIRTIGPRLTPAQVRDALGTVLDAIRTTTDRIVTFDELVALAQASLALGVELTADQAQSVLTLLLAEIPSGAAARDPPPALAEVVRALGPTPEQAEATLASILDAMREMADHDIHLSLCGLAQALRIFGPTPEQTRTALALVLAAFERTNDTLDLQCLAEAAQALDPTSEQAEAALGSVLAAIPRAAEPYDAQFLSKAIEILSSELTPGQARSVLDAISKATEPYQLQTLAHAVRIIGPDLARGQAEAAADLVLGAIPRTTYPVVILALAEAARVLGPTPEQVQTAAAAVLDAFRETDPFQQPILVQAVRALGQTPEQARAALDPVLELILEAANPAHLQSLGEMLQALGPSLQDRAEAMVEAARVVLARTDEPAVAEAFARAIAVTLPAEPAGPYVAAVVELMKWPTSVGPAMDTLAEVLHDRVPGAPDRQAGLGAVVDWVASAYPDVSLEDPPTRPERAMVHHGG
jgi:hypothetical protein